MPDARRTALSILNTLDQKHATLDHVMEEMHTGNAEMFRSNRALTNALIYGVVRWRARLDWIIVHFSKTPLSKINSNVLNILRIGVFQLLYLDRIPDSAAVDTSVELAKPYAPAWVIRYINGLLRNIARHHSDVPFPSLMKDPVTSLAVSKSLPHWLIKKWISRFGVEETMALCDAVNTIPPITIRANTLRITREDLKEALSGEAGSVSYTSYSPYGLSLQKPRKAISEHAAFQNGWFQVQDEAAQLIAMLADPKPDETVLDACAGLGGKTAHLAQLMENRGRIVAMDSNRKKLDKLETEMKRLGIKTVEIYPHDLTVTPSTEQLGEFDCILLDAPCSGLGIIRRNPDIKWSESKKNLIKYREEQTLFLANLAPLVKPGGRMIFSVCSTEPEENEDAIDRFLAENSGFKIEERSLSVCKDKTSVLSPKGGLKTYPHLHGMDGFFSICLKRSASC